jgi:hypothetical protein
MAEMGERDRQTGSKALERGVFLKRLGKYPWYLKSDVFMALGPLNLTV